MAGIRRKSTWNRKSLKLKLEIILECKESGRCAGDGKSWKLKGEIKGDDIWEVVD